MSRTMPDLKPSHIGRNRIQARFQILSQASVINQIPWLFIFTLACAGILFSNSSKAQPEERFPVIIYLKEPVISLPTADPKSERRAKQLLQLTQHARDSQKQVIQNLKGKGQDPKSLWINNSVLASLTLAEIDEISALKDVIRIELDQVVLQAVALPSVVGTPGWNLNAIQATTLWPLGYFGHDIVVAVLDSGVDAQHNAIAAQYRGGQNSWFDPYGEHTQPYDATGHGTSVLSLIVGKNIFDSTKNTAIGVAPAAKWIAARIFDNAGKSTSSKILEALQWLLDPDKNPATDDAPDVVNLSWGLSQNTNKCEGVYGSALLALNRANISVVVAAGNTGPNPQTSISPANYTISLSVGSIGENFLVSNFSGRGPSACDGGIYPKLVAPGENLTAAGRTSDGTNKNQLVRVSGTSFSASHVSGAITLLRSIFPSASNGHIDTALLQTASGGSPNNDSGFGVIQILAAYDYLKNAGFAATNPNPSCLVDSDNDGTVDCIDACPQNPSKFTGPCSSIGTTGTTPPAPQVSSGGCSQQISRIDSALILLLIMSMVLLFHRRQTKTRR